MVAQKLQKYVKNVWEWTLLWPVIINKTIMHYYYTNDILFEYLFSMRKYSSYFSKHLPLVLMTDDVMMTLPTPAWYQWPLSESGNSQSRDPEVSSVHYVTQTHRISSTSVHSRCRLIQGGPKSKSSSFCRNLPNMRGVLCSKSFQPG